MTVSCLTYQQVVVSSLFRMLLDSSECYHMLQHKNGPNGTKYDQNICLQNIHSEAEKTERYSFMDGVSFRRGSHHGSHSSEQFLGF